MKKTTTLILLSVAVAFTSNANVFKSTTIVAAEDWYEIMDNDSSNHFSHVFEKDSDGVITATVSSWQYIAGPIPITDSTAHTVPVTFDGTNFSFSIEGTASETTNHSTSAYTLLIIGLEGNHDTASGTYVMSFINTNWPDTLQGTWTGVRLSGSGITDELNGLDDITDKQVVLYPNPIIDFVSVSGFEGTATLTVSDLNGRLLLSKSIENNDAVSLSFLTNGIYLASIKSNNITQTKRLIVRK